MVDCVPYVMRFPHLRPLLSFIVITNFIFEERAQHFSKVQQLTDYNHTGVSQMLETCLLFYNETLKLEQQVNSYWEHLETEVTTEWLNLTSELADFEDTLDSLLIEMQSYETLCKKHSSLPFKDAFNFQTTQNTKLPLIVHNSNYLVKKREEFWISFDKDLRKVIMSQNVYYNETVKVISILRSQGIHLIPLSSNTKKSPSKFNVEHLEGIHELFLELDILEATQEELSFLESNIMDVFGWIVGLEYIGYSYEFRNIKYYEIPSFLNRHESILEQFVSWIDFKYAQIDEKKQQIINKARHINKNFFEISQRLEKKGPQINSLIQIVRKCPIQREIIPSLLEFVNFISL